MLTHQAPLGEALESLQAGQHSLTIYVEQMLKRIDQVDPEVRAFLQETGRRNRLRAESTALREQYPNPNKRPALYGAFVGVKDIFHVEGFTTRAGSEVPPELFADEEGDCVRVLRQAGALLAGKTVTTEFAYFEPGPTRNPHNLAHTPGGSSSGSAAAVAAGMCTLALGTQTIGSVIRPAAFCGIVGFKPSFDRIPTTGLAYFSRTADHVGLFTQDVAGMTLAASVLCRDWRHPAAKSHGLPILAVPDGPYLEQTERRALASFEEEILMLQVAGYTVKRVQALDGIHELNELHRRLIFAEFAQEHERIFASHSGLYRAKTAEAIRTGQTVSVEEQEDARAHFLKLRCELEGMMDGEGFDLWICPPAIGPAPEGIEATGDPNMNLPWTHAGMPAITVPAGRAENGLPLGMQLIARFGEDERLLAWAGGLALHLVEQADD